MSKQGLSTDFKVTMTILGCVVLCAVAFAMYPQHYHGGVSPKNSCIANLKQIDSAKVQWAMDNKKGPGAAVSFKDLIGSTLYLKAMATCPKRGFYTIGRVGTNPTCSFPNHELPQ